MSRFFTIALACIFFASIAGAEERIPNRIDQAKVGEWVMMEDVSGVDIGGEAEKTKVSVVAVGDGKVVIKREHYGADGSVMETKEHELDLARYNERVGEMRKKAKNVTQEIFFVKDREIPVTVVEIESDTTDETGEKRQFKFWISEELPIGGIAKTWCSDVNFPSAEVIDYGF